MIVKVCGITEIAQYNELIDLGVDLIGLNLYPKSKRYITKPLDIQNPSSSAKNVGVFVNPAKKSVNTAISEHNLTYIQLHGNESIAFCGELSVYSKIIKAFGVNSDFDFNSIRPYEPFVDCFLFDTETPEYGGSGKKFNWHKLEEYEGNKPFLLSGGIRLADVEEIQKLTHPFFAGIDINSGFELSPGVKKINEIKELLKLII